MDFDKELNETKPIADALSRYANKAGRDVITTWNDWLAWCCKVFEWKDMNAAGGYAKRFEECKKENPLFFEAMEKWLELSDKRIRVNGVFDAFGTLYEANYQSSFKASYNGQFFTPMSICEVMAKITTESNNKCIKPTDEVVTFNDCACGSGRTLLAAWTICDKYNRNLFYAGDLDSTSVYMCALNFLIHGMVGAVEKRDALTRDWYFGFIVNACKVPFANNICCLQYFDEEEEYKKNLRGLEANARAWNCICFRPKEENNLVDEMKAEEKTCEKKVEEIKPQQGKSVKEPIQLELFV